MRSFQFEFSFRYFPPNSATFCFNVIQSQYRRIPVIWKSEKKTKKNWRHCACYRVDVHMSMPYVSHTRTHDWCGPTSMAAATKINKQNGTNNEKSNRILNWKTDIILLQLVVCRRACVGQSIAYSVLYFFCCFKYFAISIENLHLVSHIDFNAYNYRRL